MSIVICEYNDIKVIADSIRTKSGETDTLTLNEMKQAADGIITPSGTLAVTVNGVHDCKSYASVNVNVASSGSSSGGNTDIEDSLVTRQLTSYENSRVTTIGSNAFTNCRTLTNVNFPACTSISQYAFASCNSLTTISFPVCENINANAFESCTKLLSVNFPVCTRIYAYAFTGCWSLANISFPTCTSIGINAFSYCSRLTSVSFPVCTNIGGSVFQQCFGLETITFPVCTTIGSAAFSQCSKLTNISFPACTSIGASAFRSCASLNTIYLLASSVCKLLNSNAFSGTGITSTAGSIYVPYSLSTSYKTATNWTYFSNVIIGIGDDNSSGEGTDDGNEGSDNPVNLITFSIDGIEYQAEEGMTWNEWLNSDYNSGLYVSSDSGSVKNIENDKTVSSGIKPVLGTATITSGASYSLK